MSVWADKAVLKEGSSLVKKGKSTIARHKWKPKQLKLVDGFLLIYKCTADAEPTAVYFLKDSEILKNLASTKKEFTFGVKAGGVLHLFSFETKIPYEEWVAALDTAKQAAAVLDDSTKNLGKRISVMQKAKKNIAGKVVASSFGRDALKSVLSEGMRANYCHFRQLLVNEFGEEQADALEADIIKLVVKGRFARDNGQLSSEYQQSMHDLVQKCCHLFIGAYGMQHEEKKKTVLARASTVILDAQQLVEKAMKPALTPKNFARIAAVFSTVASVEFLEHAFLLEKNREMLTGLHAAMEKYMAET